MKLVIKFSAIALAATLSAVAIPALAQVMVGAPITSKDIVDSTVSERTTTLVAAVRPLAGPTLKGAGPTIFAPTSRPSRHSRGHVDNLLKPENKAR
jgi:hypothetical protein